MSEVKKYLKNYVFLTKSKLIVSYFVLLLKKYRFR
jgi:hypothetical protein